MNKYKKLALNTVIMAIGTFSSKLLVFFLVPIYTNVLSTSDYGITDYIVQAANLCVPIISLGISEAVIRFGLDKNINKSKVFTTGVTTILCGFAVFILFAPLLNLIGNIHGNILLLYLYVFMSSFKLMCAKFVRSRELVRLYAVDGFLSTFTTVIFTIVFLLVFKWGITGYLLATILSDFCSIIFLTVVAKLYKYFRPSYFDRQLTRNMLKYSVPLIPTTVFWWIMNVSDRFMLSSIVGNDANGIYAISYKIPTIINLVSVIFYEAWQISAVDAMSNKKEQSRFFSNIFNAYQSLIFLAASVLIMFCKIFNGILVADSYYSAWKYIPFLLMATTFSCFVNFFGSVYMVEKKSVITLVTSAAGAVINIALNLILIPKFEAQGAAVATAVGCFTVFILRAVNTQRFIKIKFSGIKLTLNILILLAQSVIMISQIENYMLYEGILVLFILLLNIKMLLENIKRMLPGRLLRKSNS